VIAEDYFRMSSLNPDSPSEISTGKVSENMGTERVSSLLIMSRRSKRGSISFPKSSGVPG